MDINQAIAQVEHDLAHTLQELAGTRELLAMLDDDRKKLELELHGLRSFARRSGEIDEAAPAPRPMRAHNADSSHADVVPISGSVSPLQLASSGPSVAARSLQTMSRTDAVLAILNGATSPIDRASIHEQLFHGGREDDSLDDVSLTLSGLKRSKRVERLGKGLWQIVAAPSPRPSVEHDQLRSIEN